MRKTTQAMTLEACIDVLENWQGARDAEVGRALGVSPTTVGRLRRNEGLWANKAHALWARRKRGEAPANPYGEVGDGAPPVDAGRVRESEQALLQMLLEQGLMGKVEKIGG